MGLGAAGSDLEPKMIEYSQTNLDWLARKHQLSASLSYLEVGDATNYRWPDLDNSWALACESYLGMPFAHEPPRERLEEARGNCNKIIRKFLQNLAAQTKPGFRACIAVPAWFSGGRTLRLPLIDSLEELGYTIQDFKHPSAKRLIYHRSDQVVGRELLVLIRK